MIPLTKEEQTGAKQLVNLKDNFFYLLNSLKYLQLSKTKIRTLSHAIFQYIYIYRCFVVVKGLTLLTFIIQGETKVGLQL